MTEPDDAEIPTEVFIPSGHTHDTDTNIELELRRTEDGHLALTVYSTLDNLVANCGEEQPWILVPTNQLDELRADAPFDVVLLDPSPHGLPDGADSGDAE